MQGQVIEGIVYDRETGRAIELADIYFDGTFTGTSSDSAGYFRLDVSKYANRALNVSAVGFHTQVFPSFLTDDLNYICLVPRRYEIEEVTIGAKSLVRARRKNMEIFKREFLGTSASARSCRIVNETDISFNYGSDGDTLEAYANWSHIEFKKDQVPFEASGYYDPQGIKWQGRMGNQRAGDWLPYDYSRE
jgi:hypothetical protein